MIRQAIPEDAEDIAKVHVASWQAAYKGLMPEDFLANLSVEQRKTQWRQWLGQAEQVMMVCEVNRQIIGIASAGQPRDQDLSSDTAELYTLYLLSDYWGKGFGKQLYLATLNQLKARGYKQLALWVLDSNQRGRSFYEGMGLEADGQSKTELW